MKKIKLKDGGVTLVDDESYEYLKQFKWHSSHGYARSSKWDKETKRVKHLYIHRLIILIPPGMEIDHINNNKLDNQSSNLRACTHTQNVQNRLGNTGSGSKFKGVHPSYSHNRKYLHYSAQISVNGKRMSKLFPFTPEGEVQAAKHYNELAKKYYGEFAHVNKIP